ncbi:MAG: ATP-dependent DNA helicase RecG [Clostridia bacterium]|nr:ATP-dependent DNA helicase RecG [Clostridia bacterium]
MDIFSPVTVLRGVGEAKAKALQRLGIFTVYDLLYHFPRAYQNRGAVTTIAEVVLRIRQTGEVAPASLMLTVGNEPTTKMIRKGMVLTKFKAYDESGVCEVTFFNQGYLRDVFKKGATYRFWCRPTYEYGHLQLNSPAYDVCVPGRELDAVVPVYPLARGLSQKLIASFIREALRYASTSLAEHLPSAVLIENNICSLNYALRNIHFPESVKAIYNARKRFDFDRIFTTSVALARRTVKRSESAPPMKNTDFSPLTQCLGFELTGAQRRAATEIAEDMSRSRQMCRILCGDVGSGKTAVAAISAYIALSNGYQCALMVPTEILAKQHYGELQPLFEKLGFKTSLLVGSLKASEKKKLHLSIAGGEGCPDLIIGTHALLTDTVSFNNLGLIITDEQHRFGVNQRAALNDKSKCAHTLVMSATPIPRTLSLVYYGDLDRSVLDEMPAGRLKVSTFTVDESYRQRLNGFILKQAQEGHRTYIVCPAIEESVSSVPDDPDNIYDIDFSFDENEGEPPLKGAVEYAARLQSEMPQLKVGFVHGKMKTAEKDAVMSAFAEGSIDTLVSTTVIEVGVNVPEATLMVVENAERFGLSQLHQLRGRVGRGKIKSYCILVSDTKNENSRKRLDTMCHTSDGYLIAEEDLKLRGPGDFFAEGGIIRQHGTANMPMADDGNKELYEAAVRTAKELVDSDPELSKPENSALEFITRKMLQGAENTIS